MKSTLKLILIAVVMLSVSCKKETPQAKKRLPLLTSAGWLTVKVEEKTANGTWVDATGTPLVTQRDDLFLFYTNGTYQLNEGALKLPGDPQIMGSGTWTFVDEGSKVQIINGNLMEIVELDESKLLVIIKKTAPALDQRYTFKH